MKTLTCLVVVLFFGLTFSSVSRGQACPVISYIYGPSKVEAGGSVSLKVLVSDGDPLVSPTYNWTVSQGQLSAGQGTAQVTLDSTGAKDSIIVTVDIGGYAPACKVDRTTTITIKPKPTKTDSVRRDDGLGDMGMGMGM